MGGIGRTTAKPNMHNGHLACCLCCMHLNGSLGVYNRIACHKGHFYFNEDVGWSTIVDELHSTAAHCLDFSAWRR